jgi:WD40 repeat protein
MKVTFAALALVVTMSEIVVESSSAAAQSGAATSTAFDPSRAALVPQIRHPWGIEAMALSPDGTRIVSVGYDGSTKIWHVPSGRLLRTHDALSGGEVSFLPDGNRIVTYARGDHVKVWDATSGAIIRSIKHTLSTTAISSDGARLFSRDTGGPSTFVWDLDSGGRLPALEGNAGDIVAAAVSRDGSRIAMARKSFEGDFLATVWDAATGKQLFKLEGHRGPVWAIAMFPEGSRIATGSKDQTIRIWDMATGAPLHMLDAQIGPVLSIAVSPDGTRLAAAGWERTGVWDAQSGRSICTTAPLRSFKLLAFAPDGTALVTGDSDGLVQWWDVQSCARVLMLTLGGEKSSALAASPDGRHLVSGDSSNTVRHWDADSGRIVRAWQVPGAKADSIRISPDARVIVSDEGPGVSVLWDSASGRRLRSFEGRFGAITFAPDGRRLLSGWGGNAKIWDLVSGTLVRTAGELSFEAVGRAFSPDGKRIVAAIPVPRWNRNQPYRAAGPPSAWALTPVAKIWDIETGQLLLTLTRPPGDPRTERDLGAVAFSPDGRSVVTVGPDRADIWDAESGVLVRTLRGLARLREDIRSMAFFPDGNRVLTVAKSRVDDKRVTRIYIWDVNTGRFIGTFERQGKDAIDDVAVLNNDVIAAKNENGTIGLWDVATLTLSKTLIAVGQSDYIVLRHDGTYEVSDGARDALHLVDGNEWSPVTPEYEAAHRRATAR